MASLTYSFDYCNYDVTIVGYEVPGGWRLAVEIKQGSFSALLRDTSSVFPDFASLRSTGIWQAHLFIRQGAHPENT